MFTRETCLSFARVPALAGNINHAPAGRITLPSGDVALVFLQGLLQRRGA